MYAALPAIVSSIFLSYGLYVVAVGRPMRICIPFLMLSFATFAWQCAWVFLFPSASLGISTFIAKIGYAFILFIPATFYNFAVELTERKRERVLVWLSYVFSVGLLVLLFSTNTIIYGTYKYFFGEYPKAGPFLFLHIAQTAVTAIRVMVLFANARRCASRNRRIAFGFCLAGVCSFSLAVIDYAVNYGYAIYPPGVVFVAFSLCVLAIGLTYFDLVKLPTLSNDFPDSQELSEYQIQLKAQALSHNWKSRSFGYKAAVEAGLCDERVRHDGSARTTKLIRAMIGSAVEAGTSFEAERNNFASKIHFKGKKMEFPISVSVKTMENSHVVYEFQKKSLNTLTIVKTILFRGGCQIVSCKTVHKPAEVISYFDQEGCLDVPVRTEFTQLGIDRLYTKKIDQEDEGDAPPNDLMRFLSTQQNLKPKGNLH
ncbi:histidine kinase N-terminal 7TM domain-containing protein [Paraburkholderia sp. A2RI-6]|uniref:histidine kinase N-terminal 7TM domain-containing protein n=1 Tax=Paraburkholderia sp. A2RI-6 TaxID=3028371 RepID=UPI003B820118